MTSTAGENNSLAVCGTHSTSSAWLAVSSSPSLATTMTVAPRALTSWMLLTILGSSRLRVATATTTVPASISAIGTVLQLAAA